MAFKIGESLEGMHDVNKKKDFVKRNRSWEAEDKGTGSAPKKDDGMFGCFVSSGGVDMPVPVSFALPMSGAGKSHGKK